MVTTLLFGTPLLVGTSVSLTHHVETDVGQGAKATLTGDRRETGETSSLVAFPLSTEVVVVHVP